MKKGFFNLQSFFFQVSKPTASSRSSLRWRTFATSRIAHPITEAASGCLATPESVRVCKICLIFVLHPDILPAFPVPFSFPLGQYSRTVLAIKTPDVLFYCKRTSSQLSEVSYLFVFNKRCFTNISIICEKTCCSYLHENPVTCIYLHNCANTY